jgi:release factor glutamine methyltransferase
MASDAGVTLLEAMQRLRAGFAAAGIEEAAGDARRLLAAAINATSSELIRNPARALTLDEAARLDDFSRRRIAREPVSRILGQREFYGRPFTVTPAVLDPRADTETLIDAALAIARENGWDQRPIRILDLGTGSGAIICTLLAELPLATGVATDVSTAALEVAGNNAERLGLTDRVCFERRDIFAGLPPGFELVVSNPPYIRRVDLAALDPEVSRHDPHLALDGGEDGLDYYRAILDSWGAESAKPAQSRALVLELGADQAADVATLAQAVLDQIAPREITKIALHRDLGHHERCLTLQSRSVG